MKQSLQILLDSGNVLRCHTIPVINRQTVGLHTWRTMIILHWLYYPDYPPPRLTFQLMIHDSPELATGDVRADAKVQYKNLAIELNKAEEDFRIKHGLELEELAHREDLLLTFCDRFDLALYASDELNMGNLNMGTIKVRILQYLESTIEKLEKCRWQKPECQAVHEAIKLYESYT